MSQLAEPKARILIVENDGGICRKLRAALAAEGYGLHVENDGTRLAAVVRQFRPDLAIVETNLPSGPDGFAVARALKRSRPIPLLYLTGPDTVDDRVQALADDYVCKPFAIPELLARVGSLLRRSGTERSGELRVGDLVIDEATGTVTRRGRTVTLTPTEYDVLTMLVKNAGRVISKPQLLSALWGGDAWDRNLVEVHVSSLRHKLEQHGPRVIHTVRGMGYVVRP